MNHRFFVLLILTFAFLFSCGDDNTTNPQPVSNETVTIGSQIWMKKNLDIDHYRNGDSIPEVRDITDWKNLTTGAWCYFNNSDSLGKIYGKLYNWYAVHDPRGLAPSGYHVPSAAEWNVLSTYLGGDSLAGGKLKESDTTHWWNPNYGATNSTGFAALPSGDRANYGVFSNIGAQCILWTSSEFDSTNAIHRTLTYVEEKLYIVNNNKGRAFSVRCMKDN